MAVVGCLPNGNHVAFFQMVLYFVAAILGFFVTIPVGITLRNFHGSCILYAQIVPWKPSIIWPWSETSCDFILYMNLAVNIFYATFMGVLALITSRKGFRASSNRYTLLEDWHIAFILTAFNPVFLIINSIITVLEVAGTALITDGFQKFCNYTMEYVGSLPKNGTNSLPTSCSGLQKWDGWSTMNIVRGTGAGVDGHNFFGCLTLASIAQWILMFVWFAQLIFNVFMSFRICSCEVAAEKRKPDKLVTIAQRRSRLATPIATPGGRYTPGGFGGPQPQMMMQPMGPSKEPYYPTKTPPPLDPDLPPYRVTPPHESQTPTPPKPQDSPTPPPSMSVLKEKPVYRRDTSGSQII